MREIKRTKAEYGGFLPLELNPGKEYFADYEEWLGRFNSVKAALDFLIGRLGQVKIYIPYYYCPSTTDAIRNMCAEVCFYHIDSELMPLDLPDEKGSMVLLVDYFGICTDRIVRLIHGFKNAEVILDRAHSFYSKPIIGAHIHNVYSAKKFFGIPDGAYLISKTVLPHLKSPTNAHEYSGYLILSYEKGANASYQIKKEVDKRLANHYDSMSKLSIGLLQNVDHDRVKKTRIENFRILYEAFKDINELALPEVCPSYQFPFLIRNKGRVIKKMLIENHIFVSTLWSGKDLQKYGNPFELSMMDNAVFLPMDQRYDADDMKYLIDCVSAGLEQCNE